MPLGGEAQVVVDALNHLDSALEAITRAPLRLEAVSEHHRSALEIVHQCFTRCRHELRWHPLVGEPRHLRVLVRLGVERPAGPGVRHEDDGQESVGGFDTPCAVDDSRDVQLGVAVLHLSAAIFRPPAP
jgi:hypothetical protein